MNSIHKSKRSGFFYSLNLAWPANPVRTARSDIWGAVALVCACGIQAKLVQYLLAR